MSYILDALRKADAERERDPARGIHAQPGAPSRDPPRRGLLGIAAGAGALVVAAAAAWLLAPDAAPVAPAAIVAAPAPAAAAAQVREESPPPAPVVIPVAASVLPPAPPPLPMPVRERAPAKAAAPAAAPPAAAPPAAAPPVAAPPAASADDRILAFTELPPDVQREMLRLKISGGVHSDNASQRMLIVGGQVMNEGAEIAPGVLLEQIRARTAVLKYRAYRFSVAY